jgi:site-specific recombinase XerC
MSDSELAVVSQESFPLPTIIARAGASTRKKFFEFFTVPIRNANTRAAYYRAIQQFLAWLSAPGIRTSKTSSRLRSRPISETLQRQAAPPTVKQHMAAIRMLFSWLTEKGILAMNPAREVKTERFSRTEGKTPAFVDGEVQKLLDAIETSTHTGLRDRALLGVLAYTFARIGAVVNLKVEDYYPSGKRFLLRFKEKGGKEKELPVHHKLEELLDQYLKATGWRRSRSLLCSRPLSERLGSYRAVRWFVPMPRTCSNDGSNKLDCLRTIRLTLSARPASRIFSKMTALWRLPSALPVTPTAGPRNSMIAAARRFSSKTWSEMPSSAFLSKCRAQ